MKKEITNLAKKAATDLANKPISRKEAIKKTGYMAVSAATMMLLLNSPAHASGSAYHSHSNNSNDQRVNQSGSKDGGIWK